jgi:hypothetical protein
MHPGRWAFLPTIKGKDGESDRWQISDLRLAYVAPKSAI